MMIRWRRRDEDGEEGRRKRGRGTWRGKEEGQEGWREGRRGRDILYVLAMTLLHMM